LDIIVAIVFGFLTISISIYIAYRQGAFKKANLFLFVGIYSRKDIDKEITKKKKPPWATIVGIPDLVMDYFIIILPCLLENISDIPAKHILVQFRYRSDFDLPDLNFFKNINNHSNWIDYDIKRGVKRYGNEILVEYSIPLLSPKTPLHFENYIAVKKSMFEDERTILEKKILKDSSDNKFILEELECTFHSENLRPSKFNTWLLITLSRNMSELVERVKKPIYELQKINCPVLFEPGHAWIPPFWPFWYSLRFPKCIRKKRLIYSQVNAVMVPKKKESFNIVIQSREKTEIQFGAFDLKIPGAP